MAHSLSSKKRMRQNVKLNARNRARKSVLKSQTANVKEALLHGSPEAAATEIHKAAALLDRAANRRTLHRNAAARRKSRMAKKLSALKAKARA